MKDAMTRLDATQLLERISGGDDDAWSQLIPLVYEELRLLARRSRRNESPGHGLQTTEVIHEAYLRLLPSQQPWDSRAHFLGAAAIAMHRILIEFARSRDRKKRGGGRPVLPLNGHDVPSPASFEETLMVADAIEKLATLHERQHLVVKMKYFAQMTIGEIATVLDVSESTVTNDWRIARLYLSRELAAEAATLETAR